VAALKHSKSKYKKLKTADPLYLTSNRYCLLDNVDGDSGTPTVVIKSVVLSGTVEIKSI